jgi:hypothetical protein
VSRCNPKASEVEVGSVRGDELFISQPRPRKPSPLNVASLADLLAFVTTQFAGIVLPRRLTFIVARCNRLETTFHQTCHHWAFAPGTIYNLSLPSRNPSSDASKLSPSNVPVSASQTPHTFHGLGQPRLSLHSFGCFNRGSISTHCASVNNMNRFLHAKQVNQFFALPA